MVPSGMVDIAMEIEGEWRVPRDSRTRLAGAGLLGGSTMEILRGASDALAEPYDTLSGAGETGGILESAERLSNQAEGVLAQIHKALDDETVNAVQVSATELRQLLGELRGMAASQRTQLASLTATLNRTASGLEDAGPSAARAMARADSAAINLNRTSVTLDRAVTSLESVLGRMDAGQGTLGRLSKDDSLYANLNRAAGEIANLAADIRTNPRRYVNLSIF